MAKRYRTIVADPPWHHVGTGGLAAGWRRSWRVERERPLEYASMTTDEVCGLPVAALADRDCRLFLWATNARVPDAVAVLNRWEFVYRQTLVWRKPDVNPIGGSVAPNVEFLLVAVRGKPPLRSRLKGAVIDHPRGGLRHSEKPQAFLDLVEQVSPGPYLEMFSRAKEPRFGWDYHGDESLGTAELPERAA